MWRSKLPSAVPILVDSLQLSRGGYFVQCRRGVQSLHASNPMATDDISDPTSRGKRKHSHGQNHTANPAHHENNNSNEPSSQTNEPVVQAQWKPFHGRWQQQQPNRTKPNNNNNNNTHISQQQKKKGKGKANANANSIANTSNPQQPRRSRRVMKPERKAEQDAQNSKQLGQQIAPDNTTANDSTAPFGDANSMGCAGSQGVVGPAAPVLPSSSDQVRSVQTAFRVRYLPPRGSALSRNAGVESAKQEEDEEVWDVKDTAYPPVPTAKYMEQASKPAKEMLDFAQPLLIILDLNGTLLHRTNKKMPPRFVRRPALNHFLERVTARHMVMVWSSAQPATVESICRQIFTPVQYSKLVAVWNRTHLGLPKELYRNKVQVYKQLERVWADKKIQSKYPDKKHRCGKAIHHTLRYHPETAIENEMTGVKKLRWDQSNTVLIDDSRLKAAANPYNIFEVPEFTNKPNAQDELVLKALLERIKLLAKSNDVSRCLHSWSQQGGEGITMDRDYILDIAQDEVSNGPIINSKNKKELHEITTSLTKADEKTDDKIRRLIRREKKLRRRSLQPTPPPMPLLRPEGEWEAENEDNKEEEGGKAKLAGEKEGKAETMDDETTESISSFLNSPELLSDDSESKYAAQLERHRNAWFTTKIKNKEAEKEKEKKKSSSSSEGSQSDQDD